VDGLRPEDFEVRDSGVRQSITAVTLANLPIDLLIALDVSGSLTGERLDSLKNAVRAAVTALGPADRVMVLDFAEDARLAVNWTVDRSQVYSALDKVTASGWTSLMDAAFTALLLPESADRRRLLLVVTDGRDTASWLSPTDVLKAAEQSQTTVYAASTRQMVRVWESRENIRERLLDSPAGFRAFFLPVLVRDTGGEVLDATGTNLDAAFVAVINRFSRRYLLSYTPTGVPRQGWHPIEVKLKDSALTVTARRGYTR
jgi:Ca-activated chloride channel family protein